MRPGISILIVGANEKSRREKLDEILSQFLPNTTTYKTNLVIIDGNIGIADVRNFKTKLSQKPYLGEVQVGLVEIGEITSQAQNALLKLIEEPSESTQIIISCANLVKLLPTIISRTKVIFTSDYWQSSVDGSVVIDAQIIYKNELAEKFEIAQNLKNQDAKDWVEAQIIFWHQILLSQLEITLDNPEETEKIVKSVSIKKTLQLLKNLLQARNLLNLNINPKLLLENLFLTI